MLCMFTFPIIISLAKSIPINIAFHEEIYDYINKQLQTFFSGELFVVYSMYLMFSLCLAILFRKCNREYFRKFINELSGIFISYIQIMFGLLMVFLYRLYNEPTFFMSLKNVVGIINVVYIMILLYIIILCSSYARDKTISRQLTEEGLKSINAIPFAIIKSLKKLLVKG